MGFMNKLFGKKEAAAPEVPTEPMTIYCPVKGKAIPLEEIPDPTFSQGILGLGCGIEPEDETVYAPFNGTVSQVTDTKHAIAVTSGDEMELLIHVGMDTVDMNGKGFTVKVKEGQKVRMGDPILTFSLADIRAAGHPTTIAVVLTNSDDLGVTELLVNGPVSKSVPLMKVK